MSVKKLLVVDDEPDIRMVASLSLRRVGGYEVVTAESGEEGLSRAEAESPDLILLDVMMPDMDGLTTLKRLRDNTSTKDIPVVFMTARVQKHEISQYLDCGAIGIIEKPFDPMKLSARVNELFTNAQNEMFLEKAS